MDSLPPWPVVQSLLLTVVLPGFGVGAVLLTTVCVTTRSETGRMIGGALALYHGLNPARPKDRFTLPVFAVIFFGIAAVIAVPASWNRPLL